MHDNILLLVQTYTNVKEEVCSKSREKEDCWARASHCHIGTASYQLYCIRQ